MTKNEELIIGFDVGRDGWTSECVARRNDDGTMKILEMNQYRRTLDLQLERPMKITIDSGQKKEE